MPAVFAHSRMPTLLPSRSFAVSMPAASFTKMYERRNLRFGNAGIEINGTPRARSPRRPPNEYSHASTLPSRSSWWISPSFVLCATSRSNPSTFTVPSMIAVFRSWSAIPSRSFAAKLLPALFAVEAQRLEGRPVVHRVEDALAVAAVLVAVPGPRRDDEDVALRPFEDLAFHLGCPRSLEDLEDRRADVAVRLRRHLRGEQLQLAG